MPSTNKKLQGEELPKIDVFPIKSKKQEQFDIEKKQLDRLEEKQKTINAIVVSLKNSIDNCNKRHKEALTIEEKIALLDRIKQLMFSLEQEEEKEKSIIDEISKMKQILYPIQKSSSDCVRMPEGTYKSGRIGYDEKEYDEVMRLIESV